MPKFNAPTRKKLLPPSEHLKPAEKQTLNPGCFVEPPFRSKNKIENQRIRKEFKDVRDSFATGVWSYSHRLRSNLSSNIFKHKQMGHIKEPAGVDLNVGPMPFSAEGRQEISAIIAQYKSTDQVPTLPRKTKPRKKKLVVINDCVPARAKPKNVSKKPAVLESDK